MTIERLWAGWRTAYVAAADKQMGAPEGGGSIFENIIDADLTDEEAYILWRGEHCFALLNLYPYTSGHLLVLPRRAVTDLGDLTDGESAELWWGTQAGVAAIRAAYEPDGVNVGMNLGKAGGAGIPDHLHMHCLPRWAGDTNFMTSVAEIRVIPETLHSAWSRLQATWPNA